MRKITNYWLMKTEPAAYSIDDLKRDKTTPWEGVRNYQARNFMKEMAVGDGVLFYHSGKLPGIYGLAKVSARAHPDHTQFDPKSHYYEPRATREKPVWWCVDVRFSKKLSEPVLLGHLKADARLRGMLVRERGSRLSVQPTSVAHFSLITREAH